VPGTARRYFKLNINELLSEENLEENQGKKKRIIIKERKERRDNEREKENYYNDFE